MAIEVMREVGIDISEHRSKSLSEVPRPIQQIVTLCAEEHCPVLGEEQAHIHAPIPDPARFTDDLRREQALERFRDARDAIQRLIERLASEIFFHKV